jgi:hypothetical protein
MTLAGSSDASAAAALRRRRRFYNLRRAAGLQVLAEPPYLARLHARLPPLPPPANSTTWPIIIFITI